jgi:GNAT superfamily N-acetyltransferase
MFVLQQLRGLGIAKQILAKLEKIARENGFRTIRLETGVRQPEAIALYERAGYVKIPCWGKYTNCPLSVCYEKQLAGAVDHFSDKA